MSSMYSGCIEKLLYSPRLCCSRLRLLDSGTLKLLSGNQRIADFDAELAAELATIHQQCPSQVPPVPRQGTTLSLTLLPGFSVSGLLAVPNTVIMLFVGDITVVVVTNRQRVLPGRDGQQAELPQRPDLQRLQEAEVKAKNVEIGVRVLQSAAAARQRRTEATQQQPAHC